MEDELVTVRCACGWETTGVENDIIGATTEHGRRVHNMTPTRDEVLAMAVQRRRTARSRSPVETDAEAGAD